MAYDKTPLTSPSNAGPSSFRRLSGTYPGQLDPTQPARLLRTPDSTLSFATFDPRVANAQDIPDIHKLSLHEELCKPKRVVIETRGTGESFWRLVPDATKDDGVKDEGSWPRVVDLCGQLVEISQDQWDIYKLDPLYNCFVKEPPSLTVISSVTHRPRASPLKQKARVLSLSPESETYISSNDRSRSHALDVESSSEGEVEDMVVDDQIRTHKARAKSVLGRAKRLQDMSKNRQARREKLMRRTERLKQPTVPAFNFHPETPQRSQNSSPETKRKVDSLFETLRSRKNPDYDLPSDEDCLRNTVNYAQSQYTKRSRTLSPTSAKRELDAKRTERLKSKKERRDQEVKARRIERERRFMSEILIDIMEGEDKYETQSVTMEDIDDRKHFEESENIDPEIERRTAIEESRRKLAELEADRPLWEEQAKKRLAHERAEEIARKARREARKQAEAMQAEAERRAKKQRDAEAERERKDALKAEREEKARRQRSSHQLWGPGPWTPQRAIEQYKVVSDIFDTKKFTESDPLTMDAIPWPILLAPNAFTLADINWITVENFCDFFHASVRPQDYASFIEKSVRRFHPDRWKSRSLLKTVNDVVERKCLEDAANTVAQALTSKWVALKG